MSLIYLDNNATTRMDPRVVEAMGPYLDEVYGNPSSVHRFGQRCRRAVDEARAAVAGLLGCAEREVIFTSGGTESIHTAVRGIAHARSPRRRMVTTTVEHSATVEACRQLEREGFEVVRIGVDGLGRLDLDSLAGAVNDQTAVVSLIWANNETGVISPVAEAVDLCGSRGVPVHLDAVQAAGKVPIDVREVQASALSIAAHKFHGPKGVGALFIRGGVRIRPLFAGSQEGGRRAGTENVAGIVGLGAAARLAAESLPQAGRIAELRDRFERQVLATIDRTQVHGDPSRRVANTSNIGFERLEAEAILLLLSEEGVCASAGAACSSGSLEPSPVIRAMGVDERYAHGAVRFSFSRFTTAEEADAAVGILQGVVSRLREVLPVG